MRGIYGLVINYEEGELQNRKIAGPKLFASPPQDRVKPFCAPLFKEWKLLAPPFNMAKSCVCHAFQMSRDNGKENFLFTTLRHEQPEVLLVGNVLDQIHPFRR